MKVDMLNFVNCVSRYVYLELEKDLDNDQELETGEKMTMRKIFALIIGAFLLALPIQLAGAASNGEMEKVGPDPDSLDMIYDGTVFLKEGNFTWIDTNDESHIIDNFTPHGALDAASQDGNFDYGGSWKGFKNTAVIDWIEDYEYDNTATPKLTWNYFLNGAYQDYFSDVTGVSNNPISDSDEIEFYYGPDQENDENAIAIVRIAVRSKIDETGSIEPDSSESDSSESDSSESDSSESDSFESGDWIFELKGTTSEIFTKKEFEEGISCGHVATYTDEYGTWSGIPLWRLVGIVDGEIENHPYFDDELASMGYSVKVKAGDGWDTTLSSLDIARNDGYIVANSLNGELLPLAIGDKNKPCWPLHLKGSEVFGGQQVGNVIEIELVGLPEITGGWQLTLLGDVMDVIDQGEFEEAIECHGIRYEDESGQWMGLPLWYLVGTVDDGEMKDHWTFNETLANTNYTIEVIAEDGYKRSFQSTQIAKDDGYIVAATLNDEALKEGKPLRLVGEKMSGKDRVGSITEIRLPELLTSPAEPGSYNLNLTGKISDIHSKTEIEMAHTLHEATWTDSAGHVWSGVPLWIFCGWVDDRTPHGPKGFNDKAATSGYKVTVKADDGYAKEFASSDVARSSDYILADKMNGSALPEENWPLRLVGSGALGGKSVGKVVEIELSDFKDTLSDHEDLPSLHIIKYGPDGTTIENETVVSYQWMEENLPVQGDGDTLYRFEAVDFTGDNWDKNETYPGSFKIEEAVKGTALRDLCDLLGGMGPETEIKLIASDGYETSLGRKNVYSEELTEEQMARQGEPFLAWWSKDEGYVPDYSNGMRLFFTAGEDHIFGLWDMHECVDEKYWHYYWENNVQYPSCAGLSAKYVETIKIRSEPESDWSLFLELEGALNETVSKSYFEQALACTMGNHAAEYTDEKGRTWEGLPLWLLCGWVDDENSHSEGAYNESFARSGYAITVVGSDGSKATFKSEDTVRNEEYIVANSLNGSHISEDDSSWPLRLVGSKVDGSESIKGVAKIMLETV